MELDVRMNIEESRGSEMDIEKNREEVFGVIQNWFDDVKESFLSWIAEGEGRSKFTGMYMENDLGWLKICLEEVREEILEEKGSYQNIQLLCRLVNLKARVEVLTYILEKYLMEMEQEQDSPKELALQEEFHFGATMEAPIEASTENLVYEKSGLENEGMNEIQEYTIKFKFLEQKVDRSDQALYKEVLARKFEKKMLKAERESQTGKAVWILGLNVQQKFEPVYFLVMGAGELGSKLELKHLGPPPWIRGVKGESVEDKSQVRAWLGASMADEKGLRKNLEGGEVDEKEKKAAKANLLEPGLIWEMQPEPCQFMDKREAAYYCGLDIEILGPSPWPNTSLNKFGLNSLQINHKPKEKYVGEDINLLLSPESLTSQTQRRSFEPPPPPPSPAPAKPPPRPLDFLLKYSRLELNPTLAVFLGTLCSIFFHPRGNEDAVGDDPGDIRFHQFLSLASVFSSVPSLEDKACLKRLEKAVGCQVECESFTLPPPAEPPLIPLYDLELIVKGHMQHRLGIIIWYGDSRMDDYTSLLLAGENHEEDRIFGFFCHYPRPPELAIRNEQRMLWTPAIMKGGKESNALSYVEVFQSLLRAASPKTKKNVEIEFVMKVNAGVEEEELEGTRPRGIKVHRQEGELLTDLLHFIYSKEDYISHKELQLQLMLMFDQAGSPRKLHTNESDPTLGLCKVESQGLFLKSSLEDKACLKEGGIVRKRL